MTIFEDAFTGTGTALILRGSLAVVFGGLVIAVPAATALAIVLVFGIYSLIDGLVAVIDWIRRKELRSAWGLAGGIISLAAGVVTLLWPGITALALVFVIGFWAILIGASQIGLAFHARKRRWWWLWLLAGAVTILFGLALVVFPGPGILSILGLVAAYAIVLGFFLIAAGLWVRRVALQPRVPLQPREPGTPQR